MTAEIRTVKRTMTITLSNAPAVGGITPYKLEVVEYADRGKIVLHGRAVSGQAPRSVPCRLYGGYPQYPEPPVWVMHILSEAGWTLNKIWGDT